MSHHFHLLASTGDFFVANGFLIVGISLLLKVYSGTSLWVCPPAPIPQEYPGVVAVLRCALSAFWLVDRGWMPFSTVFLTLKDLRFACIDELRMVKLGKKLRAVVIEEIWSGVNPLISERASAKIDLSSSPSTMSLCLPRKAHWSCHPRKEKKTPNWFRANWEKKSKPAICTGIMSFAVGTNCNVICSELWMEGNTWWYVFVI